mmetsp:Transcript_2734/g.4662  ORF Transcript_2734/g.4662 Transcript_2734/m.4662 type:complete len:439 (+) Transcript_2734:1501-2817(+)
MGSNLKLVNQAPAGSIVGIGGLENIVVKYATLSSSDACPNFTKLQTISQGLVKVTVETESGQDMDILKEGLLKLNKSDPSVSFSINARGEYILSTCGQVHLERCIKDLNDDFCPGLPIQVSQPIIPFKETIISKRMSNRVFKNASEGFEELFSDSDSEAEEVKEKAKDEMTVGEMIEYEKKMEEFNEQLAIQKELLKSEQQLDPYMEKLLEVKLSQGDEKMTRKLNEVKGWFRDSTSNKCCHLKMRALGLEDEVSRFIEKNGRGLRNCYEIIMANESLAVPPQRKELALEFTQAFFKCLKENQTSSRLQLLIKNHSSVFGPKRLGTNILINKFLEKEKSLFMHLLRRLGCESSALFPPFLIEYEQEREAKALKEAERCLGKAQEVAQFYEMTTKQLDSAIVSGFEMAVSNGPLMDEPMQGAVFIVDDLELDRKHIEEK